MEQIITKKGDNDGPVSVVLVGVHGNEKCGVNALNEILPDLEIESGTVYFIYGNPRAIEKNERFTEFNLNRAFSSPEIYSVEEKETYEYKRAQEIKMYLDKSSALLDIHSTAKPSTPFIFCEENAYGLARHLPSDFVRIVSGADTVEPGATDGYMYQQGKVGFCIECGQHEAPHVNDLAKRTILSFLSARGHISGITKKDNNREKVELTYSYYTETNSFVLERQFEDFTEVKEGQVIGKDGDKEIKAPFTGLIVFARNCTRKNTEGFLMGRNIL